MLRPTRSILLLVAAAPLALIPAGGVLAQSGPAGMAPQTPAKPDLASLFDDATIGALGADLSLVDARALAGWLRPLLTTNDANADFLREFDAGMKSAGDDLSALRETGATEFWFVLTFKGYPEHAGFIAVRDPAGTHRDAIVAWMKQNAPKFPASGLAGDFLLFGPPQLTDGLPIPDSPRAQSARARLTALASDGVALRMLVQPSTPTRKAFQELTGDAVLPGLDIPAAPFINGIEAATLAVKLAPAPECRVSIESPDPDAARELGKALQSGLEAIGASPRILSDLPLLPPVIRAFEVRTKGNLTILDVPPGASAELARAMTPALLKARAEAREIDAARRLRAIAQACVLYEQNNNAWPESLKVLVDSTFLTDDLTRDAQGRPIVYLKPPSDAWQRDPARRVLAHPGFDPWPAGGVWIAFLDGHVSRFASREEFDAALAASPKP